MLRIAIRVLWTMLQALVDWELPYVSTSAVYVKKVETCKWEQRECTGCALLLYMQHRDYCKLPWREAAGAPGFCCSTSIDTYANCKTPRNGLNLQATAYSPSWRYSLDSKAQPNGDPNELRSMP